ncbi:phosphatidic acid phosphatase type 2 [Alphaentomopoxvirus acuprea]|uniref:Phosphatidic acid phosphatase type 2 n=1 Tax=Alphaentomopoxvirus acuprea TaxID=62099 RepID=W6JL83_9POXV|nr:phosphatidic acid phosphatase type 2 [Anomala cuprea entomopoxvirus]BAO49386.1 phosphatidic acid phosphatase type 2 [Anomala cuprea entomopoxvirus]
MITNIISFSILIILSILYYFINNYIEITQRGFFCNDLTIKYPYKDQTITEIHLIIIGIILPIILISITEIVLKSIRNDSAIQIIKSIINILLIYFILGFYILLITDIIKINIGRLRPYFIEVCNPEIIINNNKYTCVTMDKKYINEYQLHYNCKNNDYTKEARLSFPSKHSSFIAYTMIFTVLYLHNNINKYIITKSLVQFILIIFMIIIGVSRVVDYWHHWEDVLCGYIIGIIGAIGAIKISNAKKYIDCDLI